MKENKNIERLFQEKFKDFEVSPPDLVWENIKQKLNPKEKKRRVIPFWFKAAGIAASFIAIVSIVLYSTNTNFNKINSNQNNSVANSNKENQNTNQNAGNQTLQNSEPKNGKNNSNSSFKDGVENNSNFNSIVNNKDTNANSKSDTDSKLNSGSVKNTTTYKNNLVSNNKKQTITNYKAASKLNNGAFENTSNYKNGIVSNNKKRTKNNSFKKNATSLNSSRSEIVSVQKNKNRFKNNRIKSSSKFNDFNSTSNKSLNNTLTDIKTNSDFKSFQNTNSNSDLIDINKFNATTNALKNNTDILVENPTENSNTNTTAIVAIENTKIDTITLATVIIEENPMEKLLREKETKKVVDEKEKWSKWAVNSYVSPVFFNSFTSGSPISDEFASNQKTFKNSTSYGVGLAYNLNKRLSIKTGVSNLNLEYDTESIAFYSTFEDQSKIANTNIERNANGKYLALKHEKEESKNDIESQMIQSNQNLGTLNQKTQYIEVPLEMSYAILNKKFGVAIKGGMSTLFLTENVVSIKALDGNMQIGKASNLNNVHFSSNLGLGLSYNFFKNFQLNVEPTLKYQLNTFNKNAEDFSPYVIGLNTGISYKF